MIPAGKLNCLNVGVVGRPKFARCGAEAKAVIAALNAPTPDAIRQQLICDLVDGLITDNIWTNKLDCFWIKAMNSAANSLPNWINPGTHNLTVVNLIAGLFTVDRGWTGNGVNGFLRTHYNPTVNAINYAQDDASIGVYSRTNIAEGSRGIGVRDANWTYLQIRTPTNNFGGRINSGGTDEVANLDSRGFFMGIRMDNANQIFVKNRVMTSFARVSTGIPNLEFYILGMNEGGVPGRFTTRQYAAAFVGGGMTQTNVNNFTDRIETFMDAIGAGIIP